ncbi:GNAT family N-acetyltransferase [Variovorax humicola]|uniref:GNAT family N-acetyltransferase n=1 Tax=Variovorax humicola TaxID=1769758 RepID=A0ABU8VU01_9BURK
MDHAGDYPAHLIDSGRLADGTPFRIRPICAADLAMHTAFVHGLSPATGFARLLSPRTPEEAELRHMTDVDYTHELALIALARVDGEVREVGVARYVRGATPETFDVAEFAIVIADAWQRRGLAEKLMRRLIAAAEEAGVHRLADITLYDNRGMLALARKLGFKAQRDPGDPNVTRLRLDLPGK